MIKIFYTDCLLLEEIIILCRFNRYFRGHIPSYGIEYDNVIIII